MINLIAGLNGAGKTVYLEEIQNKLLVEHTIISNISAQIEYEGFDEGRVGKILTDDAIENIFDYNELVISNDAIVPIAKHKVFTQGMLKLITLICRKGDVLILDEPEFRLKANEVFILKKLLILLNETYNNCYIVTHCQRLFDIAEKILWVKNYETIEITKEQLYASIGSM